MFACHATYVSLLLSWSAFGQLATNRLLPSCARLSLAAPVRSNTRAHRIRRTFYSRLTFLIALFLLQCVLTLASQCSNFSCCGLALPDLHQLLDHFEEQHVLVIGRNGRPLYPTPSQPAHPHPLPPTPSSQPAASIILNYPQPDPPLRSSDTDDVHCVPFSPEFRALPELDPSDGFSESSGSGSCLASPDPAEPLCLPPSLFTVRPCPMELVAWEEVARAAAEEDTHTLGPVRRPRSRTVPSAFPVAIRPRSTSGAGREPTRRRRDGREREYKCPVSLTLPLPIPEPAAGLATDGVRGVG